MGFRNIDVESDSHSEAICDNFGSHRWYMCDKSDDGYISLRSPIVRLMDLSTVTIQLIKEPKPQIRIAAKILCPTLYSRMQEAGFQDYSVPDLKARIDAESGASAVSYCDFGEDSESQEKAKLFLFTLCRYSHTFYRARLIEYTPDCEAITTCIDKLAEKHGMRSPNFGGDWKNVSKARSGDSVMARVMNFFRPPHRAATNRSGHSNVSRR